MTKKLKKTKKVESKENFSSMQVVDLVDVDEAIMHIACVAIGILHENAFPWKVADKIK